MKIINETIKVIVIFEKDGNIVPVKFRFDDQIIKIEKVLKTYKDNNFGQNNIFFVCQHNGRDIYELKYEVNKNIWYLYKK